MMMMMAIVMMVMAIVLILIVCMGLIQQEVNVLLIKHWLACWKVVQPTAAPTECERKGRRKGRCDYIRGRQGKGRSLYLSKIALRWNRVSPRGRHYPHTDQTRPDPCGAVKCVVQCGR